MTWIGLRHEDDRALCRRLFLLSGITCGTSFAHYFGCRFFNCLFLLFHIVLHAFAAVYCENLELYLTNECNKSLKANLFHSVYCNRRQPSLHAAFVVWQRRCQLNSDRFRWSIPSYDLFWNHWGLFYYHIICFKRRQWRRNDDHNDYDVPVKKSVTLL